MNLYKKKKEKAFQISRINRRESDKLEKEANDILIEIDKIKEQMIQINKVILLTLLVSIFSCSEEEENLNPVDNGSINDVVGTWQKIGEYDENGQLEDKGTPWTICNLQSYFVLQNDGNAVMTTFFLENEIDGEEEEEEKPIIRKRGRKNA